MHFSTNALHFSSCAGSTILDKVTTQRDLGVIVDEHLNFTEHRNKVIQTCQWKTNVMRRNFKFSNSEIQLKLFKAHVLPFISYCSTIWQPKQIGQKQELENILRRFTKTLVTDESIGYDQRLIDFNLNSIGFMHVINDLVTLLKHRKNLNLVHFFPTS